MTEEIKAIIEKSLPAQVGEILKQTLEKGKKDEAELKATVIAYDNARKEIEKHLAKINDYKQFDERNSKLEARENAVSEKERNQKVFEAELKLAEAEKRTTDATNFVGMVFKSPIYRKTTFESENGMQSWNSQTNRNEFVPSGGKSKTEEKTTD